MKLCSAGAFTQGELLAKARRMMLATLAAPGFLSAYVARQEREGKGTLNRNSALSSLADKLRPFGIKHDEALRAIAQ